MESELRDFVLGGVALEVGATSFKIFAPALSSVVPRPEDCVMGSCKLHLAHPAL